MSQKHIVLTTDLSDESTRAFAPVAALARTLDARVTLLHVVEDLQVAPHGSPLAPPQSSPETDQAVADAETRIAELREQLPADLPVTCVVEISNHVARSVAAYAEQHDAELIALSTQGRSGLRRLVMGSVAEEILRHATRPVIAYPPPAE